MKIKEGRSITLLLALMLVLMNLFAVPAWAAPVGVAIDATNFPDANFRNYVSENFDKDNNHTLSQDELNAVTKIDVNTKNITSLRGVEHFTGLTKLVCKHNQLTTLDLTKNTTLVYLDCSYNQLATLDVTKNPALESLKCFENQLTTLDLTKNTALKDFSCYNNQLKALDVTKNPALAYLNCSQNQLKDLNVMKNTALKVLSCFDNKLTTLDVKKNLALEGLICSQNQLKDLNVMRNTALETLICFNNQLTTLDVTKNLALESLDCGSNKLTSLDLKENQLISGFNGNNQEYDIAVGKKTMTFDLTSLPGNFDPLKASRWAGASVSKSTLNLNNTKPSEVTYTYKAKDNYNLSVTLNVTYKEEFTITFDKNGGTGTMADANVDIGSSYTLPACAFTAPAGKEFKAWSINGIEKAVGDSITVNANITVKAIWKDKPAVANESVITINPNGGKWADGTTTPKTYTVKEGTYFTLPEAPIRDGYTFRYWKGSRYNPGDKYKVTAADHTFTAVWEKNAVSDKTSPKTGDNGMMYVYVLGLLAATSGMLILNARRNKKNLK